MRISKYFSQQKIASRRETEKLMTQGKITVNGKVVTDLGRQINPETDVVKIVGVIDSKTTVAYYKPRNISSSKIFEEGTSVFDLLPQFSHLNTIGRLDKASEGLIILSDDGVLTAQLTSAEHTIENDTSLWFEEKLTHTPY
ncbi:hypothetical protein COY32_05155 [candidate division WWE3 bacterium CG_4_10_14_0_2_um_filter_41_14]|uniref:RNA-binding S4 domain-containing protein n=1 Tax=candidate division WWE3 bacterium CG_4_10_14_0_2_um_filter_41_14 TaxID=1975072 RepID=A0A2M7TH72_UNCKA|nr:MAG: hypothetical protein COY32_05155 [candidate division WWE3 bacterium CG_4_10_14_0_2_um_filter_41_14]